MTTTTATTTAPTTSPNRSPSPLDSIRIASPCTADWNAMQGDDRKRFCGECKLHVHDLSAMTTDEAIELLQLAGKGRLCVRLHRRADGRVLTQDCPKGLRKRLRWAWARAAAMVSVLWSAFGCARPADGETPQGAVPLPAANGDPAASGGAPAAGGGVDCERPVKMGEVYVPEMGDVAAPPPPAPAPQQVVPEQGRVLMGKPQVSTDKDR